MANPTTLHKVGEASTLVDMLASAARSSSSTSNSLPGADSFSGAEFTLLVTAASGTSPTLNVYIQTLLPDGATWADICAFQQVTTGTGVWTWPFIPGMPTAPITKTDAALTVNTANTCLLGSTLRVKYVIGGTSPSYTFQVAARLYV